jgi:hypothetical protein
MKKHTSLTPLAVIAGITFVGIRLPSNSNEAQSLRCLPRPAICTSSSTLQSGTSRLPAKAPSMYIHTKTTKQLHEETLSVIRGNVYIFYGHLVNFTAIWDILWHWGTYFVHFVHYFLFWYHMYTQKNLTPPPCPKLLINSFVCKHLF